MFFCNFMLLSDQKSYSLKNILPFLCCLLVFPSCILIPDREKDKAIGNAVRAKERKKNNYVQSFEVTGQSEGDSFIKVNYKAKCFHAGRDGLVGNRRVEDSVILPKTDN